ncbi:MAG: MoxR family ATPase [Anaerolineales bacterium]
MGADVGLLGRLAGSVVEEVERAIIGKGDILKQVMAAFLAGGHILIEDFPGLGKTVMAKSFSQALGLEFKRIQFTPDLLPADITGSYILNRENNSLELRRGPIFASILLADEINRASPKTQSALLEAMQEHQVTLEGETLALPEPFVVIATQNPIEYEGTFPLPEAQLDRFAMKINVGYPTLEDEHLILSRRRERKKEAFEISQVASATDLAEARQVVEAIHVDSDIERYIVQIVAATRSDKRVAVGASPRGSLALMNLSRAWAGMQGRDFVLPDDVKHLAEPALVHRILLQPEHWMERDAAADVLAIAIASTPVPVLDGA